MADEVQDMSGSLSGFLARLDDDETFRDLLAGEIEPPEGPSDRALNIGAPDGIRPALAAARAKYSSVVVIVPSSREAEETVNSIRSWYGAGSNEVCQLEAWETLPHERLSPRADTVAGRMAVFAGCVTLKRAVRCLVPFASWSCRFGRLSSPLWMV